VLIPALLLTCTAALLFVTLRSMPKKADGDVAKPSKSVFELISKPPIFGCVYLLAATMISLGLNEPSYEPYLTKPPFDMSSSGIGLVFGSFALVGVVTMAVAVRFTKYVDPVGLLLCCPLLCTLTTIAMMFTTSVAAFTSACIAGMICFFPMLIVHTQMLMRLCRTYGMRPEEHAEGLAASTQGALMVSQGFGACVGGYLLSVFGFQGAWTFGAIMIFSGPVVFGISIHPRVMKRPLAPRVELIGREDSAKSEK